MGVPKENVIVWPKNGIEYLYPPTLIDKIFGTGPEIQIVSNSISRNGVAYSKGQLVEKVVGLLEPSTPMHPDFERMLLVPVQEKIGIVVP